LYRGRNSSHPLLRNEVLATFSCLDFVMTADQEFVVASAHLLRTRA
jgi:hypothetical protein